MSLNDAPSGERLHIGFFGRRNAGKSSIVNKVTGQSLAVVSPVEGTTTDPVRKAMELLPLGPVVIIDTPGFDDEGELGELRVRKTRQILGETDLAVLVVDGKRGLCGCDRELLALFREKEIPCVIAWNKSDLIPREAGMDSRGLSGRDGTGRFQSSAGFSADRKNAAEPVTIPTGSMDKQTVAEPVMIPTSAVTGQGVHELKEAIGEIYTALQKRRGAEPRLVSDLLRPGDQVVLVIPVDKSAPKGRLILPQQQVIRDILDAGCTALCTQEDRVRQVIEGLVTPPAMVITDSQVFGRVCKDVPEDIPLTSFSILMARYKGFLSPAVSGAERIDILKDGDLVLIAEGCTHHRQCEDIGTVKLPRWLRERTGKQIRIETSSGNSFPEDLSQYALVIHCGGCMLNGREMKTRIFRAVSQGVPVTNYGTAIAHMNGILRRSIAMLPDV